MWSSWGEKQAPLSRNCIYMQQVNDYSVQHMRDIIWKTVKVGQEVRVPVGTREVLLKTRVGQRAPGAKPEDQNGLERLKKP